MSTERVLVVTNDLRLALATCRHAQSLGLRCQVTSDALYLLLQAVEDTPRLIIIDSAIDGLDVYELCTTLRSDERIRQIPIVLLVHASDKLAVQKCKLLNLHLVVKESHRRPMPQRLEEIINGQFPARLGGLLTAKQGVPLAIPPIALN